MNCLLCPENAIESALLTATPDLLPSFPVSSLKLPRRSRPARSTSTAVQQFHFTWEGQGKVMNFMTLMPHNIETGGTWRVQLFSDAAWTNQIYDSTSIVAYDTLTLGQLRWGISTLNEGIFSNFGGLRFSVVYFPLVTAGSGIVTVSNVGNSDGYIEASQLYGGNAMELQWNPEKLSGGWKENTAQKRSRGATLASDAESAFRGFTMDINFTDELQAEKFDELFLTAGLRKQIFVSLFPGAGGKRERNHTLLAKLVGKMPEIRRSGDTTVMGVQLNIEEAL